MDSSSRDTLLKLFEEMIEWRRRNKTRKRDFIKFNWTHFHLSVLRGYVLKLQLSSDFRVLGLAKSLIQDEYWYPVLGSYKKVATTQELQESFLVLKQHQLIGKDDTPKLEELVAAFIRILIRLLQRRAGIITSVDDRVGPLEKEMRYLFTVDGDKSLISDEDEQGHISEVLRAVKLLKEKLWYSLHGNPTNYTPIVASFAKELGELFVVPKQHQLFEKDDTLKQNELVAAFIDMLLRLLQRRAGSVTSVEDRVECLEKELRFLLTVAGDKSLICGENEQVQSLLAEMEAVANEAGSLVHSVVFSTFADPIFKKIDVRLGVLLQHVDLLKANIIKFSELQPVIAKIDITTKTGAVDSLFIIDSLLHELEDLLKREDDRIADLKDQIELLQQELKLSESLIKDIHVSRYSEMEEMKEPMMRIRDVAYEAEYLINSFLVGDAPLMYFFNRLPHVIHKIKLILNGIQEKKQKYELGAPKVAKNIDSQLSLKKKRSSEVDDIIVGFEDEATDILDHLEGGQERLQIISVFGMPGLGKTTLAKKLYNHPLVKYRFDKCSWCVVSLAYHRKNLLTDILVGLKSEVDRVEILKMDEESIVERIYKILKGRRYLIVMDDIWSSNSWYDLQICFPDDGNGSRILFTSRNKDVAPHNSIIYELPLMSDEQCWELLEKKLFGKECCPQQLLETGEKIAANCRGVPLAVAVIAGILSSMDTEESAWKVVEGNLASYLFSDRNTSMMQILELSYKHLPDYLKLCFLYFGAFPEDTNIPVKRLKLFWVAEGFVHKKEKKSAEGVAEEYLMELIGRSLVTVAGRRSDGGIKTCVIHDLFRDLCLKISKAENFLNFADKYYSIYEKHHRLYVHTSAASPQLSPPFGMHVRSIFCSHWSSGVLNMKLLRVLDLLEAMGYKGNFNEIKLLVNLRYLAINYAPKSVGSLALIDSLVNLEFLVIKTDSVVYIPSVMMKMMKLRYVKFTTPVYFHEDCNRSLTNTLEYLAYVRIMSLKDEEMLRCSPHLGKLKCTCEALWVEEKGEYRYPDFSFFTQLESLNVSFSRPTMKDRYVAPPSPPLNIKKLTLSGLGLPWERMSVIGRLPNLRVLKLLHSSFVGEIWETRDGEFQQLTYLKLEALDLVEWNVPSSQHFPSLQQLVFQNCETLQEIPSEIGEIVTLLSIDVEWGCLKSLAESARQIEQEQRDNGNGELRVFTHFLDIVGYNSLVKEIFEKVKKMRIIKGYE